MNKLKYIFTLILFLIIAGMAVIHDCNNAKIKKIEIPEKKVAELLDI